MDRKIYKVKPLLCLLVGLNILSSCQEKNKQDGALDHSDIEILDNNNDGLIEPYEALDVLLQLQQENEKLSVENFSQISKEIKEAENEEMEAFLDDLDSNKDGIVKLSEIDGEMTEFAEMMDIDQDGILTLNEFSTFDFEKVFLASEEEIKERIDEIFSSYKNVGFIELSKVTQEEAEKYEEWDTNRDRKVTKSEALALLIADNTPVVFTVEGNTALMNGVITASLPSTVLELLFEHPEVETIEMIMVPGSIDDEANLRAAHYVHKSGLTTKLNENSSVSSGGTDFFLAGKRRIVEKGARIGVHSWGGGPVAATEIPKDDPEHQKYLDFYAAVGVPASFYWYTLEAAPANEMHWMTEKEMITYGIETK